jgi:purine-binding chemotaxis protein CheW
MAELLLLAHIGGVPVGIPSRRIEAVIDVEQVRPVPRAPSHIAGLSTLRSRVLTVVDCRICAGLAPTERPGQALVVEADGVAYALLVDWVDDVVEAPEAKPLIAPPAGGWGGLATGLARVGDEHVLLLDLDFLLNPPLTNAA